MEDEESGSVGIPVKPTANQVGTVYSDITLTSLFNAHVAVVNSERQAIWQRYSALLIANSVVVGFLANKAPGEPSVVAVGSFIGIILCVVWHFLTIDGWRFFDIYSKAAAQFSWPNAGKNINPTALMFAEFSNGPGDRIKYTAILVIYVFLLSYLLIGGWTIVS